MGEQILNHTYQIKIAWALQNLGFRSINEISGIDVRSWLFILTMTASFGGPLLRLSDENTVKIMRTVTCVSSSVFRAAHYTASYPLVQLPQQPQSNLPGQLLSAAYLILLSPQLLRLITNTVSHLIPLESFYSSLNFSNMNLLEEDMCAVPNLLANMTLLFIDTLATLVANYAAGRLISQHALPAFTQSTSQLLLIQNAIMLIFSMQRLQPLQHSRDLMLLWAAASCASQLGQRLLGGLFYPLLLTAPLVPYKIFTEFPVGPKDAVKYSHKLNHALGLQVHTTDAALTEKVAAALLFLATSALAESSINTTSTSLESVLLIPAPMIGLMLRTFYYPFAAKLSQTVSNYFLAGATWGYEHTIGKYQRYQARCQACTNMVNGEAIVRTQQLKDEARLRATMTSRAYLGKALETISKIETNDVLCILSDLDKASELLSQGDMKSELTKDIANTYLQLALTIIPRCMEPQDFILVYRALEGIQAIDKANLLAGEIQKARKLADCFSTYRSDEPMDMDYSGFRQLAAHYKTVGHPELAARCYFYTLNTLIRQDDIGVIKDDPRDEEPSNEVVRVYRRTQYHLLLLLLEIAGNEKDPDQQHNMLRNARHYHNKLAASKITISVRNKTTMDQHLVNIKLLDVLKKLELDCRIPDALDKFAPTAPVFQTALPSLLFHPPTKPVCPLRRKTPSFR